MCRTTLLVLTMLGLLCRCGDSSSEAETPSGAGGTAAADAPAADPASTDTASNGAASKDGASAGDGNEPEQETPEPVGPGSPNVVVVLIDTTRPDHLPPYGYDREVAPFLHRLARRSVVFTRAHSTSSWTGPSTASMFTGLYPTRHGLTRGFFAQKKDEEEVQSGEEAEMALTPIRSGIRTLPQRMQQLGYSTFGYAANINIGPELGFDRGFERFERRRKVAAPDMLSNLRHWQRDIESSSPSLLYLHFNDPHKPYNARPPLYQEREDPLEDLISRYDSEIRYVDATLRKLYDEFHWEQNTILWILSDHGEEFREHGEIGHGFSLYNEVMRVAMMVHAPDLAAPQRIDANVSLIDVLPTLLDLIDRPSSSILDGQSLVPLFGQPEMSDALEQRTLFGHRSDRSDRREKWAAIRGSWKMLHDTTKADWRLFDLAQDPGELEDRAAQHPEVAAALRDAIERMKEQREAGEAEVSVPLDAGTLEHLRALGYYEGDGESGGEDGQ